MQQELEALEHTKKQLATLLKFEDKKARYRKSFIVWDGLERANKKKEAVQRKSSKISKNASALIAPAMQNLKKGKPFIINHKYISSITSTDRRQNLNILNELTGVFDITYHSHIIVNDKSYYRSYEFSLKQLSQENEAHLEDDIAQLISPSIPCNTIEQAVSTTPIENNNTESIRSIAQAHGSIFYNNSNSLIKTESTGFVETENMASVADVIVSKAPIEATTVKLQRCKKRRPNQRKKPTNSSIKAKIIKLLPYSKPKSLADMRLLLDQQVFDELRSKSGREFSNNFIAQRVLAMSKKPKLASRHFKTRNGFISYMACVLRNELHDAVKAENVDFRLQANITATDRAYQEQERFLTEIENSRQVTPEWHFKKKLASVLELSKAYDILSTYQSIKTHENSVVITLKRRVELSELNKQVILQQAKAVYETSSAKGEYRFIDKLEIVFAEQEPYTKPINQQEQKLILPQGLWGNILQKLIDEFGLDVYRNWFSKLSAEVDEGAKMISLKASSELVKDWVRFNYKTTLQYFVSSFGMQLHGI